MAAHFPAFLVLCFFMTLTPGLDTAVVVRSSLSRGRRAGTLTALGCATGLFVHATVVALGLSALLVGSAIVFHVVRLCGAAILALFGAISLWGAWRGYGSGSIDEPPQQGRRPYLLGLMTNLMNPKATLFFLAALPQFLPKQQSGVATTTALALAMVAGAFSFLGLSAFAVLAARTRRLLSSRRARRTQETVMGSILIGLGIKVPTQPS
ncbi:lysine transporter LysE [Mycobacteroides chelonae]|nr:lysine transporter LysE [Mycobacteroides chelonae]